MATERRPIAWWKKEPMRCAPSKRRLSSSEPPSTTWPPCAPPRVGSTMPCSCSKSRCRCGQTRDWWRPPTPTSRRSATTRGSRRWLTSSGGLADPVENSHVRDRLAERDRHRPIVQHAVAERLDHQLVLIDLVRPVERPPDAIGALARDHRQLLVLRGLKARPDGRRLAAGKPKQRAGRHVRSIAQPGPRQHL